MDFINKMFYLKIISIFVLISNSIPNVRPLSAPLIQLNNGLSIPSIGFGTYPLDNGNKSKEILRNAIEVGYRMFDTAFQYDNELVVGQTIREVIDNGDYKREDFFIVTKIWNTFHSRELVRKQTLLSLKNFGLDYVDLLLMHYPTGYAYPGDDKLKQWFPRHLNGTTVPSSWQKDDYIDTYKGMEDMVRKGFAKSIGVSNFNTHQIDVLLKNTEIKPVVNQVSFLRIRIKNKVIPG